MVGEENRKGLEEERSRKETVLRLKMTTKRRKKGIKIRGWPSQKVTVKAWHKIEKKPKRRRLVFA